MMTKLSTAAWIAHELGLASSLGGLLFGKLALNPNLDAVESKPDRAGSSTRPGTVTTW